MRGLGDEAFPALHLKLHALVTAPGLGRFLGGDLRSQDERGHEGQDQAGWGYEQHNAFSVTQWQPAGR